MASPGDIIPYSVPVCNNGTAPATNVVLNDLLDPNLTLVTGTVAASCPGATVTSGNTVGDTAVGVSIGSLNPGECCTITYQAQIDDPFPGGDLGVDNTAVISSDDGTINASEFVPVDQQAAVCTCTVSLSDSPAAVPWVQAGTIDSELSAVEVDCIMESIDYWNCVLSGMTPDPVTVNGSVIDGLVINFEKRPIDGPGGTLGLGGPLVLRSGSLLPATGLVEIDSDQNSPDNKTILEMLFKHEIGHVLGIGTIWGAGFHNLLVNAGQPSVAFNGPTAIAWWQANGSGGGSPPPVAPSPDQGHWDEATFGIESMTPQLNLPASPVSGLSIAALADMNYVVDFSCAESYNAPATMSEEYDPEGLDGGAFTCCASQHPAPVIASEE